MARFWITLFSLLAISPTWSHAAPDPFSRHCGNPDEKKTELKPGIYLGTFEEVTEWTFNVEGLSSKQASTITGAFRFELRSDGSATLEGDAELDNVGDSQYETPEGTARGTHSVPGHATFTLDGNVGPSWFRATSTGQVAGSWTFTHPQGSRVSGSTQGGGDAKFTFEVEQADCNGASGILTGDMEKFRAEMRKDGFTVTSHSKWSMQREGGYDAAEQRLRAELLDTPAGLTEEQEAERLGRIADRIKAEEPKDMQPCLLEIWLNYTRNKIEGWVGARIAALKANKGLSDWPTLLDLLRKTLATMRAFDLSGLDECNRATQQRAYDAMGQAIGTYLSRIVRGHAPAEHIIVVLKAATLLAAVDAEFHAWAMGEVQRQMDARAAEAQRNYRDVLEAAGGESNSPEVIAAQETALEAERMARLTGSQFDKATNALDPSQIRGKASQSIAPPPAAVAPGT